MPPCPGQGRRLSYSGAAQPGSVLPSSPRLRSWILISACQSHSLWSTYFPVAGPSPPWGCLWGCSEMLFLPRGKFEGVLGLGPVSLQSLFHRRVLGPVQSWVEGSRRPGALLKLGAQPGRFRRCGGTLAKQDKPGPEGCSCPRPHLLRPAQGHPCDPYLGCLAHSWVCPLPCVPLRSVIGSSWQVDVSPAVSYQEMSSQAHSSCTR